MNGLRDAIGILDHLEVELEKDGTHPDFPERRFFPPDGWGRLAWSDLAFELPALVVYETAGEGGKAVVGMVIALSHRLGETGILVRSKHNGETNCHWIAESPSGLKPAYLLVKKHVPMAGIP